MIILATRIFPINAALIALSTNKIHPRKLVTIRGALRRSPSQKLVVSTTKMRWPIFSKISTIKLFKIGNRMSDKILSSLIMLIQRIVFLPIISCITHCELVILQWLSMLIVEFCFDCIWRRQWILQSSWLEISLGNKLQQTPLALRCSECSPILCASTAETRD